MLNIQNLTICFRTPKGVTRAVDDLSLNIAPGEVMGIVGESGCGKSVLALSIMGLLPRPPALVSGGEIIFKGQDLLKLPSNDLRLLRGNQISMIFQEPMTALNPVFTVGNQLMEAYRIHGNLSRSEALERAVDMLAMVGVPAPERRVKEYPYQLSGGMRQRAMIAQAIAADPQLIIADEPTSNLDVTLQARIIELFQELKERLKLSILLITHDLGVVKHLSDMIYVMTKGKIVESGQTATVLNNPEHEYTRKLTKALHF